MVEGFRSGMTTSELLGLRIRQLTRHPADLERAANMLKSARIQSQNQYLQRYKRRLQKDEYKPGELVLVQNSRLEMTVNCFKTDPRYLGPYEVVRKTAGGAYKLQELDGAIFDKSIAAFRLLPYVTRGSPDFYKLFEQERNWRTQMRQSWLHPAMTNRIHRMKKTWIMRQPINNK